MRPILFNTEMVRAILDGRKTSTRRAVKPQPPEFVTAIGDLFHPPYQRGDVLYVREAWFYEHSWEDIDTYKPNLPSGRCSCRYIYRADNPDYPVNVGVCAHGWHPSIHMPQIAARIFLRVTNVHAERLNSIQERGAGSAQAEGFTNDIDLENGRGASATKHFADLWDKTIKPADRVVYGWAANPWVWVIEFERISKEEAEKECR